MSEANAGGGVHVDPGEPSPSYSPAGGGGRVLALQPEGGDGFGVDRVLGGLCLLTWSLPPLQRGPRTPEACSA